MFCNKIKLKNFLCENPVGGCGVAPFWSDDRFGQRFFKYSYSIQKSPHCGRGEGVVWCGYFAMIGEYLLSSLIASDWTPLIAVALVGVEVFGCVWLAVKLANRSTSSSVSNIN